METYFRSIEENYKKIMYNVEEAKAKYRKPTDKIEVMAVTKTVAPEAVNHAIQCGIELLGENKVQEYLSKRDIYDKKAEIHFIGHLQSNKIKYIIDNIDLIQSVNSLKLAEEIDKYAKRIGKVQNILLEVNIGDEASKSGADKSEIKEMIFEISEKYTNLKIKGMMTIPPISSSEEFLYKMQSLYLDISQENIDNINMSILSLGMSSDYALAVKYGSTMIRIGSALFGARDYNKI